MAAEQSITVNQLLAKIYMETSDMNQDYNTASILRVLCIRWASSADKRENQITDPRPLRFVSVSDQQDIF
jgi:predicted DNA-binding ribbon-helix-helix protein